MTNARYQAEILTKDGWRIVGRSKTEQGAEKQAKRAMKAVPSATEYRIVDRQMKESRDMMTDEKKWHEVFGKIVSAIDGVSKPAWGEWGAILSNPSLHVKAYDEILKLWPQLLSYTEEGTDLYDLIDNATRLVKNWRSVAAGLLNRNKEDMNKSDSKGFEAMINHHADFITRFIKPIARARYEDKQQFEGTKMKKYQKRSELQEKTAMGYKTLIDEFDMDNVNDALSKVPGMEFAMHLGSKVPRPIKGGGYSSLKIEDINESVANITGGMDGLFEQKQMQQTSKKKLNESLRDTNEAFNSAFEQVADDLKDSNLVKNPQVYGENLGRMAAFSIFKNFEDTNYPGWESAKDFLKGFASGVLRAAK